MIGRRALAGLLLLCALLFSAVAAQSASAAAAKNTTAFTCVKTINNTGDFTDPHCDTTGIIGTSEFKHEPITKAKTLVDYSNQKVTGSTKGAENAPLKGTVFAVSLEIICEEETRQGDITNVEPGLKEHTITVLNYATELTKCTSCRAQRGSERDGL